ncbi:MAG: glycosyltransferase family 4 protein, partial [Acidimicrobiales bacterium]
MSDRAVHQLVPSAVPGDATTAHTLQVQRALRDGGFESEIYALAVHPALGHRVRLVEELRGPSRPEHHLLYQFSAHSTLADWLIGRREQVALNYHNITPPRFFHDWDHGIALAMLAGEVQLAQIARLTSLGICDSAYNAADLGRRGFTSTIVVPILLDLEDFDDEPDPAAVARLEHRRQSGGSSWLFVGAVAPHKAQHELVQALAVYRKVFDPGARLTVVGRPVSPTYADALHRYVGALGLEDAVDITGAVTHQELVAHYRDADVFVSLSRHEGFCVPLLEAMHHGLPVVARPAGAVASTVGQGGLLVDSGAPHDVAVAVARVMADPGLSARLVSAGRDRLALFGLRRTAAAMVSAVRRWTEGSAETGEAIARSTDSSSPD